MNGMKGGGYGCFGTQNAQNALLGAWRRAALLVKPMEKGFERHSKQEKNGRIGHSLRR
jgi:hypothetical protein